MDPREEQLEHGDDEREPEAVRRDEQMKSHDVDDHRREEQQPERHYSDEQQHAADDLRPEE